MEMDKNNMGVKNNWLLQLLDEEEGIFPSCFFVVYGFSEATQIYQAGWN